MRKNSIDKNKARVITVVTAMSLTAAPYSIPIPAYAQSATGTQMLETSIPQDDGNDASDSQDTGSNSGSQGSSSQPSTVQGSNGSDGQGASDGSEVQGIGNNAQAAGEEDPDDFIYAPGSPDVNTSEGAGGEQPNSTSTLTTGNTESNKEVEVSFTAVTPLAQTDSGKVGSGSTERTVNGALYEDITENAGAVMKNVLEGKQSSVSFSFQEDILSNIIVSSDEYARYESFMDGTADSDSIKAAKLFADILMEACSHTGQPDEGDFMYLNFLSADCTYTVSDGEASLIVSDIRYQMLDSDIDDVERASGSVLADAGLDASSATDYQKAKAIYDYLYDNVTYSAGGTGSAAGALGSRASSAGYAALAYYLLNDAGINTRIITGDGDAWLISEIGGRYYYLDPAADSSARNKDSYAYFLKGSSSFSKASKADWQYRTDIFSSGYPVSSENYTLSSVALDMNEARLTAGDTLTLTATSSGGGTVRFSSSDPSVASVSSSGQVTAHKSGDAVITASDGEGSATCTIHVVEEYSLEVSARDNVTTYVSGSGTYLENDVVTITAINQTRDGYRFVSWELPSGIQFLDGGSTDDYNVSFCMPAEDVSAVAIYEKVSADSIILNSTSMELSPGDTGTITWSLTPSGAYEGDITFRSSDTGVATVNSSGVVTAVSRGTATITVSSGNVSAECTVTVKGEEHVVQVVGRNSSGVLTTQQRTVTAGDVITISVPDVERYGYAFTGWTSSVSVDYESGYGSDDIRTAFIMPDSDLTMTAGYDEIEVESISLDETSITLAAGKTYRISSHVDITPENALDSELEYSSSDETVAKVSSSGTVTAVNAGTATITVTCGGKSAQLRVTVTGTGSTTSGTERLNITVSSLRMYAGRTYTLSVTKRNTGTVSFSSSNTSVATVNSSGVITGVAAGTCTITAVSESGNTSDTVEVTVVERNSTSSTGSSSSSGSSSGSGLTDAQLQVFLSNAAKYKADADVIRANAIRDGYVADGSGLTQASSNGTESSGTEESTATSTEDTTADSSRSTASQPTGDMNRLPFWTAIAAGISSLLAVFLRKGNFTSKNNYSSGRKTDEK